MDRLKNLNLSIIFKKFLICFCICNFLIIGSVNVKPDPYRIYADENIDDTNAKSIFINLAFMVMSAVGIQTVKSVTGLGNAFAGSLSDLFDQWLPTTSYSLQAITSMLISHCHVTKSNNLELGSALYNTIAGFINYLYKVPQIFTPADDPYFTYDLPGNYVNPDFYDGTFDGYLSRSAWTLAALTYARFECPTLNGDLAHNVRMSSFIYNGLLYIVIGQQGTSYDFSRFVRTLNGATGTSTSTSHVNGAVEGISYFFNYISVGAYDSGSLIGAINSLNLANLVYFLFGVGAVGGTDGTIGLPDPITRNRDTPIPNVNDGDSVPLAVPDTFAHDWPLDDDTDIPLSVPYAIPWVYDLPIDTPLDVPIDLPFYFSDPGNIPIPPAVIDVPDDWYNVPLIVEPECVSLSACLVSGVSTVSNHLTNFYNIHPEIATVTALSLGIGFALLVLGVIL